MMRLHFYRDRRSTREWRWRLYAQNGRIVATSGEGYKRPGTCRKMAYRLFSRLLAAGDKA